MGLILTDNYVYRYSRVKNDHCAKEDILLRVNDFSCAHTLGVHKPTHKKAAAALNNDLVFTLALTN